MMDTNVESHPEKPEKERVSSLTGNIHVHTHLYCMSIALLSGLESGMLSYSPDSCLLLLYTLTSSDTHSQTENR